MSDCTLGTRLALWFGFFFTASTTSNFTIETLLDPLQLTDVGWRTAYTDELHAQHRTRTNIRMKHPQRTITANKQKTSQVVASRGLTHAQFKRVPTSSRYQVSKPTASVPPSTIIAIADDNNPQKHQDASNLIASEAHQPTHQPRLLYAMYCPRHYHTCPCDKHDKTRDMHSIPSSPIKHATSLASSRCETCSRISVATAIQ